MTVKINIQVTGDHWFNRTEFINLLEQINPEEMVILNINTEAPCLQSIGVREVLDSWLQKHNKSPESILISNWSNGAEQVPYQTLQRISFSHFFMYSRNYWPENIIPADSSAQKFGLFVGRRTIARNSILYHAATKWSDHFLLSAMTSRNPSFWPYNKPGSINLEILDDWIPPADQEEVINWIGQGLVPSLDGKSVQDQYTVAELSSANCNQSILAHYHRFKIELVCETYTIGDTFFPTEKTVRPIAAGKPMIVYGPKNFLSRLKHLGFKTYSDHWDESYDQLEGPARWQSIQNLINSLIALDQAQLDTMLTQAQSIAVYNRQHLAEFLK